VCLRHPPTQLREENHASLEWKKLKPGRNWFLSAQQNPPRRARWYAL